MPLSGYTLGCQVTTYDGSSLPNVVGDLRLLVPTGDVAGLAAALAGQIGVQQAGGRPREVPTVAGPRPHGSSGKLVSIPIAALLGRRIPGRAADGAARAGSAVPDLAPDVLDALAGT